MQYKNKHKYKNLKTIITKRIIQGPLKKKNKNSTTIQVYRNTKLVQNKKTKQSTYPNNKKDKYNVNLSSETFKCTKKGPIIIITTNTVGSDKVTKTKIREKRNRTRIENYLSKVNIRMVSKNSITTKNKEKTKTLIDTKELIGVEYQNQTKFGEQVEVLPTNKISKNKLKKLRTHSESTEIYQYIITATDDPTYLWVETLVNRGLNIRCVISIQI